MNVRYIHYGVREHGMASIMNGISLHSGFIPYGGTFWFSAIVDLRFVFRQ